MRERLLSGLPIFNDLEHEDLLLLDKYLESQMIPAGDVIFRPGDRRESLRIIVAGTVELRPQQGVADWEENATLYGPGQFMGEAALLKGGTLHQAHCCALSDVQLLLLRRDAFVDLQANYSLLAGKIQRGIGAYMYGLLQGAAARGLLFSVYSSGKTRVEHDLLGERLVPIEAYYGIQTLRAKENFNLTGISLRSFPSLIRALAEVKKAAALANQDLGLLDPGICGSIAAACDEIIAGHWHQHFIVDVIQGGAGTSTNMNANEVIANRALEIAGFNKGEYAHIHPNSHVNLCQSTNDVYPTAAKIAILHALPFLTDSLEELCNIFAQKEQEFAAIIKIGRTQLQDAVPMTLGQEFGAFRAVLLEDIDWLRDAHMLFHAVNLGGTAIGTGIASHPDYRAAVIEKLRQITGFDLKSSPNLIGATPDTGSFVLFSGILKRLVIKPSKICNDLRLLASGPRCGLGEINLPAVQPGSSIMPGKVNPVIPEAVAQVAMQVIGNDLTITLASEAGQLQLNVMEPVIVFKLLQSLQILPRTIKALGRLCVSGITANADTCRYYVEKSIGLATALNSHIGYEQASAIAREALETGKTVFDIVLEKNLMSRDELERVLCPEAMLSS